MKHILLLTFAAFFSANLFAQVETDTTRFKIGNLEFIVIGSDTLQVDDEDNGKESKKASHGDLTYWSGFEVGINYPVNGNFNNDFQSEHLNLDPAQSFVYNINFAEQRIPIIKEYFGLVTGLGITNSRYGLSNSKAEYFANGDTTLAIIDTNMTSGFTKNQLRMTTLRVPLMFQINTSKNDSKNFHIAFGAIGGVRLGSNVKYKYDTPDGMFKTKIKGRYNLNAFELMGTVRVGYNDFGLFANYNLLSLYEEEKSEVAYPLSFGVSFHF
ncbi:outer membrane beta-barrel protein [Crocinitomix algicola]|uniref:outer membrane beta-barrel protein n=1 Tax=Crocinitomix algicola TaxID=1740263 RepID=UPI0008723928|nr:outer membrane beta-barrel protein [Crocinitomix algicola]